MPTLRSLLLPAFILTTLATAQTTPPAPGLGNPRAIKTAQASPLVQSAYGFLLLQTDLIANANLRAQTFDALDNPQTCILHRANLQPADKQAILTQLLAQGLLNKADDATFPGGLLAGVFPPVLNDPSACPHLPQRFWSAPGSSFGGHHSYPGGLPIHESNNDTADINLESEYAHVYGSSNERGLPVVDIAGIRKPTPEQPQGGVLHLDHDLILAAPLWHDWAKSIVFQWNADGSEFPELSIGGSGASLDNYGAPGDARTGGHHILSVAESMLRGFSPAFVITQASAHSAPTNGNEFKVVNWIRAAAIVARLDPVANGFLIRDSSNNLRLPALRRTGEVNLNAAGQTNILTEYELHNLSDADFTFSGPAVAADQLVLASLAPDFGYSPSNTATYNNNYRNVILANFSAERLYALYTTTASKASASRSANSAPKANSNPTVSVPPSRPKGSVVEGPCIFALASDSTPPTFSVTPHHSERICFWPTTTPSSRPKKGIAPPLLLSEKRPRFLPSQAPAPAFLPAIP